jgi:hypothetical protein
VADTASASWATPHEPEAIVAEVALTVPTELNDVVAVAVALEESSPPGSGEPLPQV